MTYGYCSQPAGFCGCGVLEADMHLVSAERPSPWPEQPIQDHVAFWLVNPQWRRRPNSIWLVQSEQLTRPDGTDGGLNYSLRIIRQQYNDQQRVKCHGLLALSRNRQRASASRCGLL